MTAFIYEMATQFKLDPAELLADHGPLSEITSRNPIASRDNFTARSNQVFVHKLLKEKEAMEIKNIQTSYNEK